IDQTMRSISYPQFHQYWHEPHLCTDYEIVELNASQLRHLKTVRVTGFTIQEDELRLMDLLLKKSGSTLNSMTVIISPGNQPWRVSKIPMTQLKRTSWSNVKRVVVRVPSPNRNHFFALTEDKEDNISFR
ncbi:hypothetical protein U1Q18_008430, partial [Sarracenia purpurea var. burkii]